MTASQPPSGSPLQTQPALPALPALPGHTLRLDAAGRVLSADPGLTDKLGLPRRGHDARDSHHTVNSRGGTPFTGWLLPSSRVLWASSLWPALNAQGSLNETMLNLATSPATVDGWPTISFWRREPGEHGPTYVGLLVPGLERRRLLAELRHARDSLDSMPGAVLQIEVQPDGRLRFPYASNPLLDLLGVTPNQAAAAPEHLLARLTPDSRIKLNDALAEAIASRNNHWQLVLTPQRQLAREPSGPQPAPRQRRLEISARRGAADGAVWHAVLTDVSERERLQQELQQRAETDALTRLPNRAALLVQLRRRLEAGANFAVLFMDCDRFKQINDSLGHDAGDELLRHLAQRLRHGLRPADALLSVPPLASELPAVLLSDAGHSAQATDATDATRATHATQQSQDSHATQVRPETLAARLGGDEFVVLVDGVADAAAVTAIADRLVRTMAQPYRLQGMDLVSPVSVGVILAQPGHTAEQLLRDADTAMYEAKRRARGNWVMFEPEMHRRLASNLALEGDLRQALNSGQLRAVFQPIIDIASGQVVGMEALARWHHPVRGEVSPVQFIPIAEDAGMIAELGEQMLRMACSAFAGWQRRGLALPLRLSVNLSRAQLTDRGLPQRVAALLSELGLPCERLQLEITESLAMDDPSVRSLLTELRALGVQLALDDFGTGHSSLASLHTFPVQQLKIDRAFVRELEDSVYHRALVQAVLQVANVLKLEVVAEGVETAAQARLLAGMGCLRAQGWLYARALEADAVPAFLASKLPCYLIDAQAVGQADAQADARAVAQTPLQDQSQLTASRN